MNPSKETLKKIKQHFDFAKPTKAGKIENEKLYFAKNARTLADFMENNDIQHTQHNWGTGNPKFPCKTAACALGTAAVYGLIPGLQYGYELSDYMEMVRAIEAKDREAMRRNTFAIMPVVNGKLVSEDHFSDPWPDSGVKFFGYDIQLNVFNEASLSKAQVIAGLRAYAAKYEAEELVDQYEQSL